MNSTSRHGKQVRVLRLGACALAATLLLFVATVPASAGAPAVDCSHPWVFSGGTVNVVILPYKVTSSSNRPLSDTAKRLTLLMENDILFSILKYGSVGAIRLVEHEGQQAECQPDIVLDKLLGKRPGAAERLQHGHGIVLIWGRIYEENESIYLQSYVRFLRRGVPDDFTWPIKDRRFVARMPAEAVALAPKLVTSRDLEEITRDFEQRAQVRTKADPDSPGKPMPLDITGKRSYSFYVVETSGDWMRIQAQGEGPSGWVRAGKEDDWPSTLKMGKLDLVEGVVGYLHYRAAQDGTVTRVSKQAAEYAQRALARFEQSGAGQAPLARALGESLRAYFGIFGPAPSVQKAEEALQHLREAVNLVPFNAEARNLEILADLHLAYQAGKAGFQPSALEKKYLRAASLEPDNPRLLANLEDYYHLMASAGPPPGAVSDPAFTEQAQLERRLVAVQAVREKKPFPWDNREGPQEVLAMVEVAVTDASGAVIPGAQVQFTGTSGAAYSATTDDVGHARLRLPVGKYKVRTSVTGFGVKELSVTVTMGATQSITVAMGKPEVY